MFDVVFIKLTLNESLAVPVWKSMFSEKARGAESRRHLLKTLSQSPAFSALVTQHHATGLHGITTKPRVTSR